MLKHALLIPDLPKAGELAPLLERIDASRQYSNFGPLARELEHDLAAWLSETSARAVHVVSLSTGTTALEVPLAAMRLPARARVLVPSLTFPATALAVIRMGYVPVFSDVDPDSWQLTPALASAARCDAVLPVATYGLPLDVQAWDAFTAHTGRPVLIDGASALGAQAVGQTTSVAFSLHATKPFGCGEGGLCGTSDAEFAQTVHRMSNFGFENKRTIDIGTNAKLSEYAAAVALAQLQRREHLLSERRRIWRAYQRALATIPGIRLQANPHDHAPSVLCVALDRPAEPVQEILAAQGIETRRWYCPALHTHPALEGCERTGALSVTNLLAERLIGLPFHHFLSDAAIAQIGASLAEALSTEPKPAGALA
jgi:dTDP-4-amino-4,6-dideoxygalactose transaminase